MFRKITRIGLALVTAALLSGCELLGLGGNTFVAPTNLKFFDQTLSWDEVKGAEGYEIFLGENSYKIVSAQSYEFLDETAVDQVVTVRSYRKKKNANEYSDKSVEITRHKNVFSEAESLSFDFQTSELILNETHEIKAAVRYISIVGTPGNTYRGVSFKILNRIHPLYVELTNINLQGVNDSHAFYTESTLEAPWQVIFNSKGSVNSFQGGQNTIVGQDGANGSFGKRGDTGKPGTDGYHGIYLPTVVLKGEANITFTGSSGSNGGKGGDGNLYNGGHGGNGGNGGSGAVFSTMVIKVGSLTTVKFVGGLGGNGGAVGSGTEVVLDQAIPGKDGEDGKGYVGLLEKISGIVS